MIILANKTSETLAGPPGARGNSVLGLLKANTAGELPDPLLGESGKTFRENRMKRVPPVHISSKHLNRSAFQATYRTEEAKTIEFPLRSRPIEHFRTDENGKAYATIISDRMFVASSVSDLLLPCPLLLHPNYDIAHSAPIPSRTQSEAGVDKKRNPMNWKLFKLFSLSPNARNEATKSFKASCG